MTVLNRILLRTLWGSRGRSIAVAMVVLCGTTCYIAIASAYSNLLLTRDTYYAAYRFADLEMYLERAPVTAVFKLESMPARISHQSLPMTGATGEKCSGDRIEVNRVRIFHTNSPFSLSLHKGIYRTRLYPSLTAGVKNPGQALAKCEAESSRT